MDNILNKVCCKCNVIKPLDNFHKDKKTKDGLKHQCKLCRQEYGVSHYKDNIEEIREKKKKYNEVNQEKIKEQKIRYRVNNPNKIKENNRNYRESNKDKIKEYVKNNLEVAKQKRIITKKIKLKEPLYRLKHNISSLINISFRAKDFSKNMRKSENILGCSIEFFKKFLEQQWSLAHNLDENGLVWMNWMNWDNAGKYKKNCFNYGWDKDHIIPISSAITEEDVIRLNHYTNFQPLCSNINRNVKRNINNYEKN